MNPGQSGKCFGLNIDFKYTRKLIIENTVLDEWQLGSNLLSPRIFNPAPPDSMSKCQAIKIRDRQKWWQLEF